MVNWRNEFCFNVFFFPADVNEGFNCICVEFSFFENKDDQQAVEHVALLQFVPQIYTVKSKAVVAIIADSCITSKCVVDIMGTKLIGCASHCYNLAVKDVGKSNQEFIECVKKILSTLCYPVRRAML